MPKHRPNTKRKRIFSIGERFKGRRWRLIRNIVIVVTLVVIVGVIGWSVYYTQFRPYNQAVFKMNGTTFSMRYFINTLKLYYGKAPAGTSIQDFADYVVQQIAQNETIISGSKALGVQINRDDVKAELEKSGTPVTRESLDLLMVQDLIEKQVPSNQPQFHVQAIFMESEAAVQTAKNKLQMGETFAEVSDELSRLPINSINHGDLGWVTPRQIDLKIGSAIFGDVISNSSVNTLSGPVYDDNVTKRLGYWVAKVVEKTEATDNTTTPLLHVQGILLGSEQEALDVVNKLQAGADIDELAKQLSQQSYAEYNGADLGFIPESQDPSLFEALYGQPLNTVSQPISDNQVTTQGGYWLYNVLEKNDSMALTDDQKNQLFQDLLNRCSSELQKNPDFKVENLLTEDMKDFALNQVVMAQGEGSVLFKTDSLPHCEAGVKYSFQLEVYGNKRGNTWTITEGTLPEGLSLNSSSGVISGIPRYAGGSGFTIEVNNGVHYATQTLNITIRLPLSITTDSLPDGKVGEDYSETLEILDNTYPCTWSIIDGKLPDGLTLYSSTGLIQGTPEVSGNFSFTVQVDDGIKKATTTLSINIQ
jgi:parvulin-like peptidyl-prolyl isomerase